MKTVTNILLFISLLAVPCIKGQELKVASHETFGQTINAGIGYAYYRYVGYPVPVFRADYELQVDKNITAAPFIAQYSYHGKYFWGNATSSFREYSYNETVTPVGLKITYYFDELMNAGNRWDFYASGSMGVNIRQTSWEADYDGKRDVSPGMGSLYLDFHLGSEYHITRTFGLQLDLSATMSTFGLAVHF